MAKLNENHIDEVNEMIEAGMTHREIASSLDVGSTTLARFKNEYRDKIANGKKFPEYNLTKDMEKERKKLVRSYTRIFYDNLTYDGLGPDMFEIESMLDECSFKSACSYDPEKSKFSTYCIKAFLWRYSDYKKYLMNNNIY